MAKKNSINGVKIIRRYSAATFFYGLFCLILVACVVLPLFTDVLLIGEYNESLGEIEYFENTAMDYITGLFGGEEAAEGVIAAGSPITSILNNLVWGTELVGAGQVTNWLMILYLVVLVVLAVIAIVLLIKGLRLIICGRTRRYEAPRKLSIWVTILFVVEVLILFLVCAFCNSYYGVYYPDLAEDLIVLEAQPSIYSWISLGAALVSMICMIIICGVSFANRVYVGDLPWDKDYIKNELKTSRKQLGDVPEVVTSKTTKTTKKVTTTPAPVPTQGYAPAPVQTQAPAPVQVITPQYVSSPSHPNVYYQMPPIYISNNVAPANPASSEVINNGDYYEPANVEGEAVAKGAKSAPKTGTSLPQNISAIGGHDYAQNVHLLDANIPEHITKLGPSAFSNCVNLKTVNIPRSVTSIGANCFFNCTSLNRISYGGTKEEWKQIKRGSNWLSKAGTTIVVCTDGAISVNPYK